MKTQLGLCRLLVRGLGPALAVIFVTGCITRQALVPSRPARCVTEATTHTPQETVLASGAVASFEPARAELELAEPTLPPFDPNATEEADTPAWNVSLAEAIQIGLENNKEVAVLGIAPREAATFVVQEESVFDPALSFDARFTDQNQQLSENVETFGTGQNTQRRNSFRPSPGTPEMFSINRLYSTGTRTRLGYLLDSSNADPVGLFTTVNPAVRNRLGLTVEQPLLRGAGRSVNRAPILVAQSEQEQSQFEFQTRLQKILLDLQNAYWQLYGAEHDLRTRRQALEAADSFLRGEQEKLRQGESDVASVAQAEAQTQQFRIDHLQAYRRRLDAERELRRLMGLPPADQRRLATSSQPQLDLPKVDWGDAVRRATNLRPELAAQQAVVRAAEWEQLQRQNGLLPNVSLVGEYAPHGLGSNFARSISSLSSGQFADWSLGVRYSHAFGRRADRAIAERAQLAAARERAVLRNLQFEVLHQLQQAYQQLRTAEENLRLQHALREAAEKQLQAREALHKHGGYATTDLLLRARSAHADAVRDEWLAIGAFNQALARWRYALGDILNAHVQLASPDDEPTPQDAQPPLERLPPAAAP